MYIFRNLILLFGLIFGVTFCLSSTSLAAVPISTTDYDCKKVSQIPRSECKALVALYNSTDGPNWSNNNRWLANNKRPCRWYGVTCWDGHITSIKLDGESGDDRFGMKGSLPAEIGNLSQVTTLSFKYNELSGAIPPEIGNLSNLALFFYIIIN